MEIDYTVSLDYGDDEPDPAEPSPSEDDIARWIMKGMAQEGIPSANVSCVRQ